MLREAQTSWVFPCDSPSKYRALPNMSGTEDLGWAYFSPTRSMTGEPGKVPSSGTSTPVSLHLVWEVTSYRGQQPTACGLNPTGGAILSGPWNWGVSVILLRETLAHKMMEQQGAVVVETMQEGNRELSSIKVALFSSPPPQTLPTPDLQSSQVLSSHPSVLSRLLEGFLISGALPSGVRGSASTGKCHAQLMSAEHYLWSGMDALDLVH